ncbi:hypothetical protein IFR05_006263 [Cadophora sp. M221]|nr:hypothetical protein IFR05_006263 [Cadophora sp. M221]
MASNPTTRVPQLGFRALKIMTSFLTLASVLHYYFLPFSPILLHMDRSQNITHVPLYITIEHGLLISLLGVKRNHILFLALLASTLHLHLIIYQPHLLISSTTGPYIPSLIFETFTNVFMLLLASHISRSTNTSAPIAAWISIVVLQGFILWASGSWTGTPLVEFLKPWSEVSFPEFYFYNYFLFARLLLNSLLTPILVCITINGEMKMKVRPGPFLPPSLARKFFNPEEERKWVLELLFARVVGNGTRAMMLMCCRFMAMAPVVYIAWVIFEVFVKMTVELLGQLIRIVF